MPSGRGNRERESVARTWYEDVERRGRIAERLRADEDVRTLARLQRNPVDETACPHAGGDHDRTSTHVELDRADLVTNPRTVATDRDGSAVREDACPMRRGRTGDRDDETRVVLERAVDGHECAVHATLQGGHQRACFLGGDPRVRGSCDGVRAATRNTSAMPNPARANALFPRG